MMTILLVQHPGLVLCRTAASWLEGDLTDWYRQLEAGVEWVSLSS